MTLRGMTPTGGTSNRSLHPRKHVAPHLFEECAEAHDYGHGEREGRKRLARRRQRPAVRVLGAQSP